MSKHVALLIGDVILIKSNGSFSHVNLGSHFELKAHFLAYDAHDEASCIAITAISPNDESTGHYRGD